MEMNLSQTAFLVPNDPGYDLRSFTPTVEVDLSGHAKLASAIVRLNSDGSPVDVYFSRASAQAISQLTCMLRGRVKAHE